MRKPERLAKARATRLRQIALLGSEELVAQDPPPSYRTVIINRLFGFDHPDAIKPIAGHRYVERFAERPSTVLVESLIDQTEMRVQDVVRWSGILRGRGVEDLSQEGGVPKLNE